LKLAEKSDSLGNTLREGDLGLPACGFIEFVVGEGVVAQFAGLGGEVFWGMGDAHGLRNSVIEL
jgi:hypothetical protein